MARVRGLATLAEDGEEAFVGVCDTGLCSESERDLRLTSSSGNLEPRAERGGCWLRGRVSPRPTNLARALQGGPGGQVLSSGKLP